MATTKEVAWFLCLRRINEDGASGFGPGRGRPWGRVARVFLRSKVKVSEWSIFVGERLLGAVKRRRAEERNSPFLHGET